MSRNYEVQIEVFPWRYEDDGKVSDALVKWGMEIDGDAESFDDENRDGWAFWGRIQLPAGQTEQERHEVLRKLLPDHAITTRWRWVDDQPWDEIFLSEPLLPAA